MPEKTRAVAEAFDRAAAHYDASPYFPLCGERLVALAGLTPGAQVLDVATGTGAVLFPAAERVGRAGRVTGIDIAPAMVATANEEIGRRAVPNAEAVEMDATALAFPDGSFDAVLCGFVLWFIPDLDRALTEIRRVLRPGGRLAVSTWGPPSEFGRRYMELFRSYGGRPRDLSSHSLVTPGAVTALLEAAGFEMLYAAAEEVGVTFADEEAWWRGRMGCPQSHDPSLAAGDLARFKRDVFALLQPMRIDDGIRQQETAIFVVARRPAAS